jgi:membrane glycosyltransferase
MIRFAATGNVQQVSNCVLRNSMRYEGLAEKTIFRRRCIFFILVIATVCVMTTQIIYIFSGVKFSIFHGLIVCAFIVNMVWTSLAFWNALFGFILLSRSDDLSVVSPLFQCQHRDNLITARTAIVMTMRDEDPVGVFARLQTLKNNLDKTSSAQAFGYFILSDSSRPSIIEAEARIFGAALAESRSRAQIIYRHRAVNEGFKPGNVRDFCARWGADYTFMLLLDADSLMTSETVLKLVGLMEMNPQLGILQSLIVGIFSSSLFARVFEFGHRHGLRCSIVGAAWWQGDRCQYWGHNAVIRLAPFSQFCEMPFLPGKGPFSGHIICHDQIEASFMHRAGYEVRTFPQECGSYEGIPPTLLEFMRRNHRWCQGNFKNLKLVGAPGLAGIDRIQLAIVAQRFIAWPALVAVVAFAAIAAWLWPDDVIFPAKAAISLYFLWLAMFFAPKILGTANAILKSAQRYGGGIRLVLGGLVEIIFSALLTPITMVGASIFMIGFAFGHDIVWDSQQRNRYDLSLPNAFAQLWIETFLGLALVVFLAVVRPSTIIWFSPFWLGLVLAVPFAILTLSPQLNLMAVRWRVCAIPEELDPPAEIRSFRRILVGECSASRPEAIDADC